MGMTMTQKILARHAGLDTVTEGQLIKAKLDMVLGNDITSPVAINEFEKNGLLYEKYKIKTWKDKLPDMSRIFTRSMPSKKLGLTFNNGKNTFDKITILVKETCIAEIIHIFLCIIGLRCTKIWKGIGGVIVSVLYILGNLPFIMIQRYNRPRFKAVLKKRNGLKIC